MPTLPAGTPVRPGSIQARRRTGDAPVPLGLAVIDPRTQVGEMATIFRDQVRRVARRAGVDHGELLGRALAHEVGHLLLRAPGHSDEGLMRAVWTDAELAGNRREDWLFAPTDRHRLQIVP
jgi:hypothetical protein